MSAEPNYRRELLRLTDFVKGFLVLIDHTMKQPEGEARGKRVADLANKLQFKNDTVRRFTLELDWNGRPLKRRQPPKSVKSRQKLTVTRALQPSPPGDATND